MNRINNFLMNSSTYRKSFLAGIIFSLLLLGACATNIRSSVQTNPPPGEAFSNFTAFEMKPATLAPAFARRASNKNALARIQENLSDAMTPVLRDWNQAGAAKGGTARTLVIEPVVTQIKFVGTSGRFRAGSMAGSSAVIMDMNISEKETGEVIATPEFYAKASAWGGSFTLGATDNMMLSRIAQQVKNYLTANYAAAVGGPSGAGAQ